MLDRSTDRPIEIIYELLAWFHFRMDRGIYAAGAEREIQEIEVLEIASKLATSRGMKHMVELRGGTSSNLA